jgi:hypothetical protein
MRKRVSRSGRSRTAASASTPTLPARAHRGMTAVERAAHIDFVSMDDVHAAAVTSLVERWRSVRAEQIEELAGKIAAARALSTLSRLAATTRGADDVRTVLEQVTDASVRAVLAEADGQGATVPAPNPDALLEEVTARADAIAELLAGSLSEAARRRAVALAGGALPNDQVAELVRAHLDGLSDAYLTEQFTGAVTAAQNGGRRAVLERAEQTDVAVRYYASELLDASTCTVCAAIDGTEYDTLAAATAAYPTGGHIGCLGGPRCRGTIVAVFDEAAPSVQ